MELAGPNGNGVPMEPPVINPNQNQPANTAVDIPTQPVPVPPKNNKKILILVATGVVVIILIFLGLWIYRKYVNSKQTISPNSTPGQEQTQSNTNGVVNANNQFAFGYYSKLKEKNSGNIFFSPFSISSALAMTYEGARGQTASEILSVFHFPQDETIRRNEFMNIYDEINKASKEYTLKTANALWVQKDYPFLKDYMDLIGKFYSGKATNLDFGKDAEGSREVVNKWVEDQTNNKIVDLIPPGALNSLTRMVLTNAIYFKGSWVKQFNEKDTQKTAFRKNNNETVEVNMMQRTDDESKFDYAENNSIQILGMPYSGKKLSMIILLPKNDDLASLENSLTLDKLTEWKKNLKNQRVDVFIPKFKFETKYFMAEDLTAMGMPTAFDASNADFSGMDGSRNLSISSVIHQAFVEVNEEGTEAAAATAVVMVGLSLNQNTPQIPVFRADHPFIFLIQDNASGNILFMGRVSDPSITN